MGIFTLLAFFYGTVGGATSFLLLFLLFFRKTEHALSDTVRKKARKHAEFDAVAKEAAVVAPAKVETLCKMVRFDDGIVGDAIQCRMVFYGSTIDVYKVDKLCTLPDHRHEVVSEHMLGRINRACVSVTSQRISKYHRHRNQSTRYAAIKGKCTVLNHKDGMPLFLEDPNAILKERLRCVRERQAHEAMVEQLCRRSRHDGKAVTEKEFAMEMRRMQCEAYNEGCDHFATAARGLGYQHDWTGMNTTAPRGSGAPHPSALNLQCCSSGAAAGRRGADVSPRGEEEVPLSRWTCVAIKFPTRRVQERWLNLLQSTPESAQWHDFITHLPQMDVFNLLIARLFFENSRANTLHDLLEEKLKKKLARVSKSLPPKLRGNIFLDSLDVGGEIPLISNVSDPVPSTCGDTEFDFDVLYRGGLALKIRFSVLYRDIRVPDIIFSIKVLELAGRMRFAVGPPPTRKFWLGGPQPPQLRLEFTQEVASHDGILNAVLRLLPDMSKIASNIVKVLLFEDMVFPNMDDFPWPIFGEDSDDDDSATAYSDVADTVKRDVEHRGATPEMPSTPPLRPIPHSASPPNVAAPQSYSSSCGTFDSDCGAGALSLTRSPLLQSSLRTNSTSSISTLPHGLPPRPPRVASSEFLHGNAVRVPTSRAPRLLGSPALSGPHSRSLLDSGDDACRSTSGTSSHGGR
ncbi:conserved hypothetical protein [Leishmania mexicana MHOM/GT/2001/U1103]|uniref:SMP-LTD domain-containing protein n=1 Tax=Leishmania mexicana (strain MHOM/GT/2001/U1103) TaxID=929439 RepID=E9AP17_LEIMU|nr:conserved hypothetical protein [Leishmania mexicana MHOM/GT/2001/U1103]CBZ24681.1 conserved hypothetical protein [Leishmania mexicana MHOM/GT/2001/U1103]